MNSTSDIFATPSKKHANPTAPTIKELYEAYTKLCKAENLLHPLTSTEFRDVVGSLETLSLVSSADGKAGSLMAVPNTPSKKRAKGGFGATTVEERRVAGVVSVKELEGALTGNGSAILRGLLRGGEL